MPVVLGSLLDLTVKVRAAEAETPGKRKERSFPDGQKRQAEQWLSAMQADVARGDFIDPRASRATFQEFAEKWLGSQSGDPNTRASMESQLRLHAFPRIGSRQLGSFQPGHMREFVTQLAASGMSGAYARVIPKAKSCEHAAAREHGMHALRHFYASVLLDAGESIKALAEYLGHSDPGLTLKVYAHLMPSSRDRARKALGRELRPQDPGA
ncbi:tyrosine-type recombinase/integrase [Streptomyces sp. NPDC005131]